MGQFIHILSSRLFLEPGKALFVFVKNTLPQTGKNKLNSTIAITVAELIFCGKLIQSLYLVPLSAASLMNSVYEEYKDKDGFLYMCYSSEKTFG